MEDSSFLANYGDRDVVAFTSQLHKVGKLRDVVKEQFFKKDRVPYVLTEAVRHLGLGISSSEWFDKGIVLRDLKYWW